MKGRQSCPFCPCSAPSRATPHSSPVTPALCHSSPTSPTPACPVPQEACLAPAEHPHQYLSPIRQPGLSQLPPGQAGVVTGTSQGARGRRSQRNVKVEEGVREPEPEGQAC